ITTSSLVLFRRVLREGLRYNAFKSDSWWRSNLREIFRENRNVDDPDKIRVLQDQVKTYRFYLKSTKDLQTLLEEYNIGIPVRERVEKSSKRVGLQLPDWPEERHRIISDRTKARDEALATAKERLSERAKEG
ncbi:hypothetical protein SAMD00019534_029150, partial [Acytostelium subglobosum LB1]|uniref:hypothetical protein n=1 Tax=Acytostelium subglobosum LB1 TaxID=1410327 RepID=UPI000644B8E4